MMKAPVITKFREFLWYFHLTLYFIEHFLLSDCYPWPVMKIKVSPFLKIKSQPTVNWRSKETEYKKLPLKKELKFHFSDFMYKWEHTVFIFLWYISLSIMHSKSITFVNTVGYPSFHCIIIHIYIYIYTIKIIYVLFVLLFYIYKTESLHFTPETHIANKLYFKKKFVLKIKPTKTDIWLSKDICNHTELALYREKLMI